MNAMSFPAYTCALPIANLLGKTILRLVSKWLCMASWHQLEEGGCDVAAQLEESLKDRGGKSSWEHHFDISHCFGLEKQI